MIQNNILITGASSGIGYALACQYAQKGYGIIGVGRNEMRLNELEKWIKTHTQTPIYILNLDLGKEGAARDIEKWLAERHLEIDILINNAGFGLFGNFADTDITQELNMINVQIKNYLELSKMALTQMLKRDRGKIINISSLYAWLSVPRQSVYAATKTFMDMHATALQYELRKTPIEIYLVFPGAVDSRFLEGQRKIDSTYSKPDKVAKIIIEAVEHKKAIIVPGVLNKILGCMARILPRSWLLFLIDRINSQRGL